MTLARSFAMDILVMSSIFEAAMSMSLMKANPIQLAYRFYQENEESNRATMEQLKCLEISATFGATVVCVSRMQNLIADVSTSNGFYRQSYP